MTAGGRGDDRYYRDDRYYGDQYYYDEETRGHGGAWQHGTSGHAGLMGASGPLAADGVARLVGPVHRDAAKLASWTGDEDQAQIADPRQIHRAGDASIAAMCQHLATMDRFVYPEVRRVMPRAEGRIQQLRTDAHHMMETMRAVQQCAQGDTHGFARANDLRADLSAEISEHGPREEELLREYDEVASPRERADLAADYERMLPKAPSRPHPYLATFGPFAGPVGFEMMGWFDGLLNTLDSREIAGAPVRAPGEVGPWGTWLLGRPPRTGQQQYRQEPAGRSTTTTQPRTTTAHDDLARRREQETTPVYSGLREETVVTRTEPARPAPRAEQPASPVVHREEPRVETRTIVEREPAPPPVRETVIRREEPHMERTMPIEREPAPPVRETVVRREEPHMERTTPIEREPAAPVRETVVRREEPHMERTMPIEREPAAPVRETVVRREEPPPVRETAVRREEPRETAVRREQVPTTPAYEEGTAVYREDAATARHDGQAKTTVYEESPGVTVRRTEEEHDGLTTVREERTERVFHPVD